MFCLVARGNLLSSRRKNFGRPLETVWCPQIIGGSEFWKYVGIDCITDLSWNMLGKSIKSIPLLRKGILIKLLM